MVDNQQSPFTSIFYHQHSLMILNTQSYLLIRFSLKPIVSFKFSTRWAGELHRAQQAPGQVWRQSEAGQALVGGRTANRDSFLISNVFYF